MADDDTAPRSTSPAYPSPAAGLADELHLVPACGERDARTERGDDSVAPTRCCGDPPPPEPAPAPGAGSASFDAQGDEVLGQSGGATVPGARDAGCDGSGEPGCDVEPGGSVRPVPPPAALVTPATDRGSLLARLGDRIAELSARIQAATYELLVLIREFDEREGWDGCVSCAQWLSWRAGLAPGAAREHVRVARALGKLPKLSDAMRRGKISYSKVRAVTRVATPDNEDDLLYVCQAGTAAHVERIARAWRRIDRNVEQEEEWRQQASRGLRTWVDEDGMVVVRGRLTPEVGSVLRRALEAACDQARRASSPAGGGEVGGEEAASGVSCRAEGRAADGVVGGEREAPKPSADVSSCSGRKAAAAARPPADGEEATFEQRQADAIGMVAETALAGGLDRGTAGDRYQVVLHVDAEALGAPRDVPAGTSVGAESGPPPRTRDDRVPAEASGRTVIESAPAGGDRVPARTSATTRAAVGDSEGGPSMPTEMAGRERRGRRLRRTSCPCPGARPAPAASDAAACESTLAPSEPVSSAPRARGSGSGRAHRQATSVPVPSASAAVAHQTVLDEAGGIHVSAETARRLACDAATVTMRHGTGGEILDVGRRTRTISPALRRALAARDRQCRFPGCGNRRCDAHHVEHWADGGRTALDNLVLLCRRHHRAVHEGGFRVSLDAAGAVRFLGPDGRPRPDVPPAPAWTGPALQPTNDALAVAGIEIGADTATPSWGGEPLDLDWAMHVLWRPRCESPAE